ncbi:uncharacterized protein BXZ73DRAFT_109502 [Epithele typhae]|uniref:uncharacterized protein n=1 Tax=Epithele typhae TaxID=378194 RepID=UPI0020081909|nr:uncharacterized protein BXZ73DRAFT_109502 [Epithele typhae]KAH9910145.1 hypothetical protein BXZ73DRAFT_109502 [Epithele typhae]
MAQVEFATSNPFPDPQERANIAQSAFREALALSDLADDFHTLTRKDMKLKAAVTLVPTAYGLCKAPRNEQHKQANKAQVSKLLANEGKLFHCEDPVTGRGRFQHQVIAEIIHEVFFSHPSSLGCIYQDHFKTISNELIALVLTSVRHTLKMYETGLKVTAPFRAVIEYKVYDQYLDALSDYDSGSVKSLWRRYRRDIFKQGLAYSGCVEKADNVERVVDVLEPEAMEEELQYMLSKYGDDSGDDEPRHPPRVEGPSSTSRSTPSGEPEDTSAASGEPEDTSDADEVEAGRPSRGH